MFIHKNVHQIIIMMVMLMFLKHIQILDMVRIMIVISLKLNNGKYILFYLNNHQIYKNKIQNYYNQNKIHHYSIIELKNEK